MKIEYNELTAIVRSAEKRERKTATRQAYATVLNKIEAEGVPVCFAPPDDATLEEQLAYSSGIDGVIAVITRLRDNA